jgi:GT2 family glycosyltransferase
MKIAWITVNYNQERFLSELFNSITHQSISATNNIFVVDNSDSLSPAEVDANLLSPKENLGYFGGFNYCLDRIEPRDYDAVVFTNPDVTFDSDFLKSLKKALNIRSGEASMILAPRITLDTGVEQNPNVVNPINNARKIYYGLLFSSYLNFIFLGALSKTIKRIRPKIPLSTDARKIFMAHGACFVATRSFFKKCRRLDQRVFLWGEEAFLMHQVAQNGGEIWFEPSLRVFHHEHSATGQITSKNRFKLMQKAYQIYREFL